MAKKSSTYKRTKKAPKWQLPLLLILVLVAVGFGVFIVFFSRANTNSPQVYLTTSNTSAANAATNIGGSGGFTYGIGGDKIIACNWDGANYGTTNVDTIGAYRPSTGEFFLNNNNGSNAASLSFNFGSPNDVPICGSWYSNPDTKATVGVFRNGTFYLASSNTNGGGTVKDVNIGANGGDVPLACDWNGDGKTDLGYYRPSEGKFYLYLWFGSWSNVKEFQYGPANNLTRYPICGNWDGSGPDGTNFNYDTVGFYDTTNGTFYLRNTNSASADIAAGATVTKFADPNTLKLAPVTGRFSASPTTFIGGYTITQLAAPAPTTTATTTTTTTTGGAGGSAAPSTIDGDANTCTQKTLRRGNVGTCVAILFLYLDQRGRPVSDSAEINTNTFGTNTEGKVKDFQWSRGITIDGIVGPQTWGQLKLATDPRSTTTPKLAGNVVSFNGVTINTTCTTFNNILDGAISTYNNNIRLYDAVWPKDGSYWRTTTTWPSRYLYINQVNLVGSYKVDCNNPSGATIIVNVSNNFTKYEAARGVLNNMVNKLNTFPPINQGIR